MKSKEISVSLQGKSFSFLIPGKIKNEDFLEIVNYVDDKYTRIKNETGERDVFKLGLLSSVNIAEELFSLKKENEKLRQFVEGIDRLVSQGGDKDIPVITIQTKKN